jgi:radical SAM protein with 4Fe4S-binding SPASM domain
MNDKNYILELPWQYNIDTGNICNLKCRKCPTGLNNNSAQKGFMSFADFVEIINRIQKHAARINLMNWGEPFLNPDVLKMIKYAADRQIQIHMDSNLSSHKFSESDGEAIVKSGLSLLDLSANGATQEAYKHYSIGGNLDKALSNLELVEATRIKLNSATPILTWQYLVHKFNESEIDKAKTMASELGVSIMFMPMGALPEKSWESGLHRLQKKGGFRLKDWTFYHPNRGKGSFLFFTPDKDKIAKLSEEQHIYKNLPLSCNLPFNRMVINWDGNIFPCCQCYGDHFTMANILTSESAEAAWNSKEIVKVRKYLLGRECRQGSVCEHYCKCKPFHKFN